MGSAAYGRLLKEEWKFAGTKHGAPFVTASGVFLMPGLPVANLDFPHRVHNIVYKLYMRDCMEMPYDNHHATSYNMEVFERVVLRSCRKHATN